MKTLILHLQGTSPEKISMKRLAQYLKELSSIYGSENGVSFDSVSPGSAKLKANIDESCYEDVVYRVSNAPSCKKDKNSSVNKAYARLAGLLSDDGIYGDVETNSGRKILKFPKNFKTSPLVISKHGSIQGKLYSVGGKGESIPVRLEGPDGETLHCEADVTTASRLGNLLFSHLRVSGIGEWERQESGEWKLKKLIVKSFKKIEHVNIVSAIEKLRETYNPRSFD